MLGPIMDTYLKHYQHQMVVKSQIPGQLSADLITFDYRNTKSPKINENYIEFDLLGDFIYHNESCYNLNPKEI